jgi:DNA-binding transcriptional LysR family regulator
VLHDSFMRGFATTEVPTPCPSLPMYLIWHRRHQNDAAHRWLRERINPEGLAGAAPVSDRGSVGR